MHFNTESSALQRSTGSKRHGESIVAIFAVAAIMASAFIGCSAKRTSVAMAANPGQAITITEQDSGKTISMATGQTLFVGLASNPSTGYQWMLQGTPAPLELAKSDFAGDPQQSNVPGAGGTQQLQLTAKAAGTVVLTLEYRRPWEKDVPPARTYAVTVVVK